jgi:site-specific recombinase XerD
MNNPESTAVVVGSTGTRLDLAISSWLHAKYQRSRSEKTRKAYVDTLTSFRAALQKLGLDLDSLDEQPLPHVDDLSERQILTATAEIFAAWSSRGKEVALTTINQRLSILSSFYEHALRHDYLDYNPIKRVDRAKVEQYSSSRAFESWDTKTALASIDTTMTYGKRDYAILAVMLATGRRVSEVASLRWRDVVVGSDDNVTLYFSRLKGGKKTSDELGAKTSRALLTWLRTYYNDNELKNIAPDAPLWVSLSDGGRSGNSYGRPLSTSSFRQICKDYFGTWNIHRLRHTWTKNMIEAEAPLPLIQEKLGHSSLATTGRYAKVFTTAKNPYIDKIADSAGIE